MSLAHIRAPAATRARLIAEFCAFYLAAPMILALVLPPSMMFPALFGVTALGLVLLHLTPGFHWSDLTRGLREVSLAFVVLGTLATLAVGYAVMVLTAPEALWLLLRANPGLMLMIALLYPVLSALPQEIVFRPLFFRRYGTLLPGDVRAQVVLNAAVFSLAHLMYWNWIVAAMTFSGGLAFAYAYRVRRNFPEAVLLHSLAGIVVFALGLGVYFYSGNVVRPF
ncbi:CPBP family intramembrane glutamic endopeptidase [Anianabacter salinae]|uniref:CPBP family intramembrane glutamic endopeptidase n=1 Tax=Anianabacter salinae TaxID=2851023 RepID=UPI00225E1EC5|nr:CPBP family intramembrane glutamic endopeptidase [Anianabacter salinae]MBV0912630.1 CPBP family intramembrane metalloprotease [Anianabacter salinae]